jgi:curved DNA-binding protein CbpA
MLPDYYAMLGVAQTADLLTIKAAYRQKALHFHPDRGGSHQQMLAINEAFHVLANPSLRREYDALRRQQNSDAEWVREQASARQHAEQYPRSWTEFDGWLDGISADFAKAEYGAWQSGAGVQLPTAGRSVTGWAFIIGGALAACWTWMKMFEIESGAGSNKFIGIVVMAGGAWIGQFIHSMFQEPAVPAPTSLEPLVVACRSCGQKLRVQPQDAGRVFRCGKCQTQFTLPDGYASPGQ